ncbi:MAG: SDR family NAD(P)-dependent oxidoreductase [Candidatus Dormibacteria bacterium]
MSEDKHMKEGARPLAVITGATAGIGLAFAERLAGQGHDLVLAARDEGRLTEVAGRLSREHGIETQIHSVDLADRDQTRTFAARVTQYGAAILINNAGFGTAGGLGFLEQNPDDIEDMIAVHNAALTRLSHAALPGMIERGRGAVINVASLSGFMVPRAPVYSASKAFVIALTFALQPLVVDTEVTVQALCPGWTLTEFHDRMGVHRQRDLGVPEDWWMTAEDLVDASLAGLQMGEVICVPGLNDQSLVGQWLTSAFAVADSAQRNAIPADRYRAARVS